MTRHEPAIRVHSETGIREEVSFFGDRDPAMFFGLHLPAGEVKGAVVSCPSVHAELIKAYRKDVLLGRTLAEHGYAMLRYHYRGAGNSEGSGAELTLDAMIASVEEARAELAGRTGVNRFGYHGTRLGAFAAATAAENDPGAPLALWSPVIETDEFMREIFRSHYIAALKGEEKPEPTARMVERVKSEGEVELLGYNFSRAFYESLEGRRLDVHQPKGSSVLLVPFGPKNMDALVEPWTAGGAAVTVFENSSEEAWWLAGDATKPEEGQERIDKLIGGTASWIIEQLEA